MKRRHTVMIVDDEPLARKTLRLIIERDPGVEIVGESGNGPDAVRQIRQKSPDILFLDVQMPRMNGFEVLKAAGGANLPVVVFVTAYDRYALKAFDAEAVDYLMKPFDDARCERALLRAKASLRGREIGESAERVLTLLERVHDGVEREPGRPPRVRNRASRLLIKSGGRVLFLNEDEIDWIAAADYYVEIHAAKAKYLHRESLDALVKRLDPSKFLRIHRSAIVNLNRVREVHPSPGGDYVAVLVDGTCLKLSRTRRHLLKTLS